MACSSAAAAPLRRGRPPTISAPSKGGAWLRSYSAPTAVAKSLSLRCRAGLPACTSAAAAPLRRGRPLTSWGGRGAGRPRSRLLSPSRGPLVSGPGSPACTSAAAAPLRRGRPPQGGVSPLVFGPDGCRQVAVSSSPSRARWTVRLSLPLRSTAGGRRLARPTPQESGAARPRSRLLSPSHGPLGGRSEHCFWEVRCLAGWQ